MKLGPRSRRSISARRQRCSASACARRGRRRAWRRGRRKSRTTSRARGAAADRGADFLHQRSSLRGAGTRMRWPRRSSARSATACRPPPWISARWAPSTGLLLLVATLLAVVLTNSPLGPAFEALWRMPFGLLAGETAFRMPLLRLDQQTACSPYSSSSSASRSNASSRWSPGGRGARPRCLWPRLAGGMLLARAHLPRGGAVRVIRARWAIPTTTDTAFAVAIIAMLGNRVPVELRIFLTAAVVIDDLVAIAIVAVFYSSGFAWVCRRRGGRHRVMLMVCSSTAAESTGAAVRGARCPPVELYPQLRLHATLAGVDPRGRRADAAAGQPAALMFASRSGVPSRAAGLEGERASPRPFEAGACMPSTRYTTGLESPAAKLLRSLDLGRAMPSAALRAGQCRRRLVRRGDRGAREAGRRDRAGARAGQAGRHGRRGRPSRSGPASP